MKQELPHKHITIITIKIHLPFSFRPFHPDFLRFVCVLRLPRWPGRVRHGWPQRCYTTRCWHHLGYRRHNWHRNWWRSARGRQRILIIVRIERIMRRSFMRRHHIRRRTQRRRDRSHLLRRSLRRITVLLPRFRPVFPSPLRITLFLARGTSGPLLVVVFLRRADGARRLADRVRALLRVGADLLHLEGLPREEGTQLIQVRHDAEFVGHCEQDHVGGLQDFGNVKSRSNVKRLQRYKLHSVQNSFIINYYLYVNFKIDIEVDKTPMLAQENGAFWSIINKEYRVRTKSWK